MHKRKTSLKTPPLQTREAYMLIEDFKAYTKDCMRDLPPPCSATCPLRIDVRSLIEKINRGNFTSAYRQYRNEVLFPDIVSRICHEPCSQSCVRKKDPINLKALERTLVLYAQETDPIQFNIPAKPYHIAIIGAGLSGLSCALKLASRNYKVSIYDKKNEPGGSLDKILPKEAYLEEIKKQFSSLECTWNLGKKINNLEEIKNEIEADAFYLAPGIEAKSLALLEGMDENSLGTQEKAIFIGGEVLGVTLVEAIEHGIRASFSIEKFLQTGAMDGTASTYEKDPVIKEYYDLPLPPPQGETKEDDFSKNKDESLSQEEAKAESLRCVKCNCSQCYDHCELMQYFKSYPKKMVQDTLSSIGSKENITLRLGMKMINSCSLCGFCKDICPHAVDMEECLINARRVLHQEKVLPPVFHDFWLRDMENTNTKARFLSAKGNQASYLFFPGCQLGASDPHYVIKSYQALLEICPDTALLQSCCGIPADWAGDEKLRDEVLADIKADWESLAKPTIILACPSCHKNFKKYFPEADYISL